MVSFAGAMTRCEGARDAVLVDPLGINARGDERIVLQVMDLTAIGLRNARVSDHLDVFGHCALPSKPAWLSAGRERRNVPGHQPSPVPGRARARSRPAHNTVALRSVSAVLTEHIVI